MKLFSILLAVSLCAVAHSREFREITSADGKKIEAELIELNDGMLKIRSRGRVFEVPVERLSEADQTFFKDWSSTDGGSEEGSSYYTEEIFFDDFSGEGFGEQWSHYVSESVVEDGVLVGKTIDINNHAGVDAIRFQGRQDVEFSVKFRFAGPEAERFNVWFDDKALMAAHAGHVCNVTVSPTSIAITDAKTGNMENSIYEMKKSAAGLDEATKELLATKTERIEVDFEKDKDEWHDLLIQTKGALITVSLDGKEIGSLESEGVAHETKSSVSVTTYANDVHYDDYTIRAVPRG
ncbi:hypothetical protein N9Z18_00060 [Verrucomicrobiales bacterium]|nr:hypothetical protein [Verrucomicrobiales bacterium]MDB4358612.1 hypothetical protein [Verrucomicrobiales bacterium]